MSATDQAAWDALARELDDWHRSGQRPSLWWRDDDAVADTPALRRLLDLAGAEAVPVALAVIPGALEDGLLSGLQGREQVHLLSHGFQHRNQAPAGHKKAEFGPHRPVYELLAEAAMGWERLTALAGDRAVPVFVPPWNRLDERLIALLPHARFVGLSRFGPRRRPEAPAALVEVNCHVDPIAWRRDREFLGTAETLDRLTGHLAARRTGEVDPDEPTGLLTHHLAMDAAGWSFLADLLRFMGRRDGRHWLSAKEAFSVAP